MLEILKNRLKGRVLILCIGNETRGDDGIGPALAKSLAGKLRADVLNCEEVPESFTGRVKELAPEAILVVDAVEMKAEPGSMALIEKENLDGFRFCTTHGVPLKVLLDYIGAETKADILLIGIQPESLRFGDGLGGKAKEAVDFLGSLLIRILG